MKNDVAILPDDSPFYYLNLFNAPLEAQREDIINILPDLINDAFLAGTSNRCWDLQFKDKISLFKFIQHPRFDVLEREVFIRTSMKNNFNNGNRNRNNDRGTHREEYSKRPEFKAPL